MDKRIENKTLLCVIMVMIFSSWAQDVPAQSRLSIVDVVLQGELDPAVIDSVTESIEEGIQPVTDTIVRPEVVRERLSQAGMNPECTETSCLTELGLLTQADMLLTVQLQAVGQSYTVEAKLLLARDASELETVTARCDVCTWDEALHMVTRTVAELRHSIPGVVLLIVSPREANLRLDGETLEQNVDRLTVAPGTHELEASLIGYDTLSRSFELEPGQELTLSLELQPIREHTWWRSFGFWGYLSGGLGLATLVPGVVLLSLDGSCRNEESGACVERYDTLPSGAALSILAGALVSTSLALLSVHYSQRRSEDSSGKRENFYLF